MSTLQDSNLFEHLFALERRLHSFEVRSSKNELLKLLSPSFLEFGSSGTEWSLQDILDHLPAEDGKTIIESSNFKAKKLSDGVVLVTYISKHVPPKNEHSYFLRSSIWRLNSDEWQMEFHQGTPGGSKQ